MKNSIQKKAIIITLLAILLLILFSVNVKADDEFKFTETTKNVYLNGTSFINYEGGSGDISWESNNNEVVSVDELGSIKANKIGTATITATRGTEKATCTVNVVYSIINVTGNSAYFEDVNLILEEHPTENLKVTVEDANYEEVSDAVISIKCSDTNIVTVNEQTKSITAVSAGKTNVTVSAEGVSKSFEVNVYNAPTFTDFSKAKYEVTAESSSKNVKISGITPDGNNFYYYIITKDNKQPSLPKLKSGDLDTQADGIEFLTVNTDENYIYNRNLSKYYELNQDIYMWIIEQKKLESSYYNENGDYVSYVTKFVDEGKKLDREGVPLNLVIKSFYISSTTSTDEEDPNYTSMWFYFPTDTENRKFTLKIGKVTDYNILSKIQKNDYNGIKELLTYAKNNSSIYEKQLTTTMEGHFSQNDILFDGKNILENKAYYYIYVDFDDEGGKYFPVEGINLAQAYISSTTSDWELFGYTSTDFKWDDLRPTGVDETVATGKLPQTGETIVVFSTIIVSIIIVGLVFYTRFNRYKDI